MLPISLSISILLHLYYKKYLFLDNTITTHLLHHTIIHYPSFLHSIILKYYYFTAHKHISISFSISLTIPLFLESNITNVVTQKTTPAATISSSIYYIYPSYYLSHTSIYFTNTFLTNYPYILLTYISNLFYKHHISQNIYFLPSPYILMIPNTLPRTRYKNPFSWKAYEY